MLHVVERDEMAGGIYWSTLSRSFGLASAGSNCRPVLSKLCYTETRRTWLKTSEQNVWCFTGIRHADAI